MDGRRLDDSRRVTSGMEKASVLPLPVLPRPSTSRPAMVSGSVFTWMGKGSVMPCAERLVTNRAGTPSSAKEVEVIVVWCLSGIGACHDVMRRLALVGEIAGGQNRSPRESLSGNVGAVHDVLACRKANVEPRVTHELGFPNIV